MTIIWGISGAQTEQTRVCFFLILKEIEPWYEIDKQKGRISETQTEETWDMIKNCILILKEIEP
jgi:hypothetical protein